MEPCARVGHLRLVRVPALWTARVHQGGLVEGPAGLQRGDVVFLDDAGHGFGDLGEGRYPSDLPWVQFVD